MSTTTEKKVVDKHRDNPTSYSIIITGPYHGFAFTTEITNLLHLMKGEASKNLFALLLHLFNTYPGYVYWVKSELAEKYDCSQRSIYNGIEQLIDLGLILKSENPNVYWINFDRFNDRTVKPLYVS